MTREDAIKILQGAIKKPNTQDGYLGQAIDMAIKALEEQESCKNCISRAEAIYLADELKYDLPDNDKVADEVMAHNEGILEYQTALSLLPSVQPKVNTGHWIEERTYMECPNCYDIWHYEENQTERFKCCPNCGAKMESEGRYE